VIYLYVDIECRDCNFLSYNYYSYILCGLFFCFERVLSCLLYLGCGMLFAVIIKYALELQGYGTPNGHTDTSAARLVLSAQPTQLKLDEAHSRESEAIYGKSFGIKATLKFP